MQDDRERLGKGRLVDRDTVGYLVALPGFSDKALTKRSLNVRHWHRAAIEAHVQALVLLAPQAVVTAIAGSARRNRDAVTDREAGYGRTERLDGPSDLVTEDHGLAHPHGAEATMVEIMQIRSADTAGLDGDLDLARARRLRFSLFNSKIAGRMNDDGFHCCTPGTTDVIGRLFIAQFLPLKRART